MCFFRKKKKHPMTALRNEDPTQNRIFSEKVWVGLEHQQNALLFGESDGINYCIANILQGNSNYVVQDVGGKIYSQTRGFLEREGYQVQILNLTDMYSSNTFNPFAYVDFEEEIEPLVRVFRDECINIEPNHTSEWLWLWLRYIHTQPKENRTFAYLMDAMRRYDFDDIDFLDAIPEVLNGESVQAQEYAETIRNLHVNAQKSTIVGASIRLAIFNLERVRNLTSSNDIDIQNLDTGKKALFVITPEVDTTFNGLAQLLLMNVCRTLLHKECKQKVMLMLHDAVSCLQPLLLCKKNNVDVSLIVNDVQQIKKQVEDNLEIFLNSFDYVAHYRSAGYETVYYVARRAGEAEITHPKQKKDFHAKCCMTRDELLYKNENECIIIGPNSIPCIDTKYDYTNHPNYLS